MQEKINRLVNLLNYLVPEENYPGKKLTDKQWIQRFIPFAPYIALLLCFFILILGLSTSQPKPFGPLLTPHGVAFIGALFWTSAFLFLARFIQKKKRSPAFFLLLANIFPLKALVMVTLFLGFQISMKKKFEDKSSNLSQVVQQHHESAKHSVNQERQRLELNIADRHQQIKDSLSQIDQHLSGGVERLMEFDKETDRMMREEIEKNHQEFQEMEKRAMESLKKQPTGAEIFEKHKKFFFEGLGRGPANKKTSNEETSSAESNTKETANLAPQDPNEHPENNH